MANATDKLQHRMAVAPWVPFEPSRHRSARDTALGVGHRAIFAKEIVGVHDLEYCISSSTNYDTADSFSIIRKFEISFLRIADLAEVGCRFD
jgi:hypothetical protein